MEFWNGITLMELIHARNCRWKVENKGKSNIKFIEELYMHCVFLLSFWLHYTNSTSSWKGMSSCNILLYLLTFVWVPKAAWLFEYEFPATKTVHLALKFVHTISGFLAFPAPCVQSRCVCSSETVHSRVKSFYMYARIQFAILTISFDIAPKVLVPCC